MDRELIVAVLQEVKDTCEDHEFCTDDCPYYNEDYDECYLKLFPNKWDVDEIL